MKPSCILVDDEKLAREVVLHYLNKLNNFSVVGEFSNPKDALECVLKNTVDLVFLDIEMNEINGLELAKKIPKTTKIIFTTAYRKFALEGFNLGVLDYLLKPFTYERFLEAIHKFENVSTKISQDYFIEIKENYQTIKINTDEIIYIESFKDYLIIHLKEKNYKTKKTLTHLLKELPSNFRRIHRSYAINLNYLESHTKSYVVIQNLQLPIGTNYSIEDEK